MATVAELERQLIRTETVAANAVAEMDRQLTDAKRMLAAVVLAAGGDVRVRQRELLASRDATIEWADDPEFGGIRFKAKG